MRETKKPKNQKAPEESCLQQWLAKARRGIKKLRDWPYKTRYVITFLTFCVLLLSYVKVIDHYFPSESYTAIRGTALLGSAVYDNAASSDIAVVEINDRFLDFVGESWPPSYAAYAAMLDDIALYQPASVFMDVAFIHTRPDDTLPHLVDSICKLHDNKIRVYLAGLGNEQGELHLRPGFETAKARNCYTLVGIRYDPAPNTKLALTYPLIGNGQDYGGENDMARKEKRSQILSAAYAIAKDHDRDKRLQESLNNASDATMALNWSLVPHPVTDWTLWEGCTPKTVVWWELLPHPLRALLLDIGFVDSQSYSLQPACPSHRHVPLNLITDPQTEQARDWLRRNLQSKHVMVGASVAGVNDNVQSPVHGDLPGIYLHAMALDNLLTYGDNYKQPGSLHERNWMLFFVLTLALGLINYRVYAGLHRWLDLQTPTHASYPQAVKLQRSWKHFCPSVMQEIKHLVFWASAKAFEIAFSILLALAVFYVMQRTTTYSIPDLAQLIGVVLALQWTGVTANVVNAVIRVFCIPNTSTHNNSGDH